MTQDITQLIKQLKAAPTARDIALETVKLLRACGVFNVQAVGYELARISVTSGPEGGN